MCRWIVWRIFGAVAGREAHLVRRGGGISAQDNAVILSLPLGGKNLSFPWFAVWTGPFGFTIHESHAARRDPHARHTRIPHASLHRRPSDRAGGRRAETDEDCMKASKRLNHVMNVLGIERHPTKGTWGMGVVELHQLGIGILTRTLRFTVTASKQIRQMAGKLLRQAGQEAGMVSAACLTTICGTAVSMRDC